MVNMFQFFGKLTYLFERIQKERERQGDKGSFALLVHFPSGRRSQVNWSRSQEPGVHPGPDVDTLAQDFRPSLTAFLDIPTES